MVVNGEWFKKGQPFLKTQMLSTAVAPVCAVMEKELSYGC